MRMKKIGYIIVVAVLMFTGCSGTSGKEDGNDASVSKVTGQDGGAKAASQDGKLEHLTSQTFKLKVMDYEKNPQAWVFEGDKPAIVDFYADWCRPCKMVAPIMDELAKEYKGKVRIYKVNTDEEAELSRLFNIRSIPAILYVPKTGKPQMAVGMSGKDVYIKTIQDLLLTPDTIKK